MLFIVTFTLSNVNNPLTDTAEFVYVFCRRKEFNTFTANKKLIGYRDDTKQAIYENVFNFFQSPNNNETQSLNKATFSVEFVKNIIRRYVIF